MDLSTFDEGKSKTQRPEGSSASAKLTATLGTSSLVVLQQVQSSTAVADRSPRSALPQPSGLLLGVHPELLGVASIHLETSHRSQY